MAKKFIDAEKLIEHLEDNVRECGNPDVATEPIAYGCSLGLKGALSYARTLPTADVVEVVRCKDCRYANDCGTICRYSVGKAVEPDIFAVTAKGEKTRRGLNNGNNLWNARTTA